MRPSPQEAQAAREEGIYYPTAVWPRQFHRQWVGTLATGAYPQCTASLPEQWSPQSGAAAKASAALLEATTLARSRSTGPDRSRTFCLAINRDSGSLLAGRSGAKVFWMTHKPQFTTGRQDPDWLAQYNRLRTIEKVHKRSWTRWAQRRIAASGGP